QQADQDGDDGNHDQQLDQREATPPSKDAEDWHEDTSWKKQRRRENGERSRKRERGRASRTRVNRWAGEDCESRSHSRQQPQSTLSLGKPGLSPGRSPRGGRPLERYRFELDLEWDLLPLDLRPRRTDRN